MSERTDVDHETGIAVTFHPQKWTDTSAQAHEWNRKQLIPAPERDPVTYVVPLADGTDEAGTVYPDESYEANQLQDHPEAPTWVQEWDDPYYVTTELNEE
ncbi:hypothetical protein [Natronobacterium texcoconense]|uniref:Uncharacterized protein n=1 Tax=Natronobacterium texcoconense TaxID=1095778 RepID=A0A1H1HJJ9_NATTX|nr:hypothetical protein [Natronobacterium texcoconense]SDR25584.1 hypothetical protein SAMN04489842_2810 [Natronobacterium texcoconense]